MDNKPKKYLFDNNDFDEEVMQARALAIAEAKRRPSFSQEEMEASRQTGFAQGREEGLREAMASLDSQLTELMSQISNQMKNFEASEQARTILFVEQASLIAAQILDKSIPALQEFLALPQLQNFLTDILLKQVKKSNLIIYIPTRYETPLTAKIAELAATSPNGHTWQIKTSDTLSSYQCQVEWDGGGAYWNPERVANAALEALAAQIPDNLKNLPEPIDEPAQNPHNEPDNPDQGTPAPEEGD